jgi:serine/threonine protein kinase
MKRCPICRTTFPGDEARFCPADGAVLESEPVVKGDPFVGTTIEGKYRIVSRLGAGGMGAVYKAHHLLLGRDVAVKVLRSEMLSDPRSAERFRREAQAAARLEHPNAVTIYDFGISSDGNAYLVMELLRGTSLRDLLDRDRVLPIDRAVEIFSLVCSAIDRAHQLGIVHRDLKPDNIMIDERPDGSTGVKVVDFGIAMLQDLNAGSSRLTGTGMVVGTANYMSPEHCRGQEVDARSDIYSLAIVLYEMLTGRVPFEAPIPSAVIVAHVSDPPPPPTVFRPDLSPAVERVLLDGLAKRPDDRPQSAGEFARRFAATVRDPGAAPGSATVVVGRPPTDPTAVVGSFVTDGSPRPGTSPSFGHATVPATGAVSAPHPQTPLAPTHHAPHAEPSRRRISPMLAGLVVLAVLAVGGAVIAAVVGVMNWRQGQSAPAAPIADSGPPRPIQPDVLPTPPPVQPAEPQPEPEPTVEPVDPEPPPETASSSRPLTEEEGGQVEQFLAEWISSSESRDIDWHMRHYADRVDYYQAGPVSKSRIRADRERAYSRYDHIEITVPRIFEATLEPDGTVRIVFDKAWEFVGSGGNSTGKVKQQLLLRPAGGTLEIVGEKDLAVY